MRKIEARFYGRLGNWTISNEGGRRLRGWRVVCNACRVAEVISLPHGILPPDQVIKKLERQGWRVEPDPCDDLCSRCNREYRAGRLARNAQGVWGAPSVKPQSLPLAEPPKGVLQPTEAPIPEPVKPTPVSVSPDPHLQLEISSLKTKLRERDEELLRVKAKFEHFVLAMEQAENTIATMRTERQAEKAQHNGLAAQCQEAQAKAAIHFELFRKIHEQLITDRVSEAIDAIEQAFPKWPWMRRIAKEKGSLAKKPRTSVRYI